MVEKQRSQNSQSRRRKPGANRYGQQTHKKFVLEHITQVRNILDALLCDCYNTNPLYDIADYRRDRETIDRRCVHEGISFAAITLPGLFESILTFLETGLSDYRGWKLTRGAKYPAFLRRLIAPVYERSYSEEAVLCIGQLYQVCAAFKKLEGPLREGGLQQQLLDFVEVDSELRYLELDNEAVRPILSRAQETITEVLKGLDPTDLDQSELFLPRPGPGATNTPTKAHVRFRPNVKYTKLQQVFNYDEWFYPPHCGPRSIEKPTIADVFFKDEYNPRKPRRPWDLRVGFKLRQPEIPLADEPTSRLEFVPKTYVKARGICIEQLETQFLQQAIRYALYHRIERHPITRGFVNFTDQNVNGRLALISSRDGRFATIDMSSASDRISRKLVMYLFAGNKPMLDALLALSTDTIELPDTISFITDFPCAKYAPMGSALCFPVMALVHFALIKAICELSTVPRDKLNQLYVYGDDIIVPVECVQAIYDWLPMFGMKLNTGKSFYRSRFRESCGIHAYNGVNVTPVRFKTVVLPPPHKAKSLNVLVSALQTEYALFNKGYTETARLIRKAIYKVKGYRAHQFPVVSPKSGILGWIRDDCDAPIRRTCTVPRRRWNAFTQQFEFRVRVVTPFLEKLPPLSEKSGYLRKLVTRVLNDAKHVEGSCKDFTISYKWVPEPAF